MIRITTGYGKIPVIQYDLEGNFIRNWESISVACQFLVKKVLSFEYECPPGFFISDWSSLDDAADYLTNLVLSDKNESFDDLKNVSTDRFETLLKKCVDLKIDTFLDYKWSYMYEFPDPEEYFKPHPNEKLEIEVSNLGRVKYIRKKFYAKCFFATHGYVSGDHLRFACCVNQRKKTYSVHNLVMETFFPNKSFFREGFEWKYVTPCVIHLDGDRKNNNLKNLTWGTRKDYFEHKRRRLE